MRVFRLAQPENPNQHLESLTANLSLDPADKTQLQELTGQIQQMAVRYTGKCDQLLGLLRVIEALHRNIREDLFQPALPTSRHELFALLRDIEAAGGWPYIYRLKIEEVCQNLDQLNELENINHQKNYPNSTPPINRNYKNDFNDPDPR
jgi:hypothetical protein